MILNKYACHIDNYVSIYTPYELSAINNVSKSTGMHTVYIAGTCP